MHLVTSWLNSYAIACGTGSEKSNPGQRNFDTIWLRLAASATFIRKELYCPVAMARSWAPRLVNRFDMILLVLPNEELVLIFCVGV